MKYCTFLLLTEKTFDFYVVVYLLTHGVDQTAQPKEGKTSLYSHNGSYGGIPWKNDRTIGVTTVAETKFARCDVHTVASEDGKSTINDWIFIEEMDAVNVLVQDQNQKFAVFKQGKYAIPGETYSPVGGFVDKGEAPWESARREVIEELGLGSRKTLTDIQNLISSSNNNQSIDNKAAFEAIQKMERSVDSFGLAVGDTMQDDADWVYLGKYRTAANRGGGFIYTYLLKNAVPIVSGGGTANFQITGDDEEQQIHFLTYDELKYHLTKANFQEVKWAATIALALLHMQEEK